MRLRSFRCAQMPSPSGSSAAAHVVTAATDIGEDGEGRIGRQRADPGDAVGDVDKASDEEEKEKAAATKVDYSVAHHISLYQLKL